MFNKESFFYLDLNALHVIEIAGIMVVRMEIKIYRQLKFDVSSFASFDWG